MLPHVGSEGSSMVASMKRGVPFSTSFCRKESTWGQATSMYAAMSWVRSSYL